MSNIRDKLFLIEDTVSVGFIHLTHIFIGLSSHNSVASSSNASVNKYLYNYCVKVTKFIVLQRQFLFPIICEFSANEVWNNYIGLY